MTYIYFFVNIIKYNTHSKMGKKGNKMNGNIIGIGVQKGGVGKSTTSNFISYELAERGHNVILVDLDPQATQTGSFFGFRIKGGFKGTISLLLKIFVILLIFSPLNPPLILNPKKLPVCVA